MTDNTAMLTDPAAIRRNIIGGNSTFTLRSRVTDTRFTYKVKSIRRDDSRDWSTSNIDKSRFFVSLLVGDGAYVYLGMLDRQPDGYYVLHTTAKSRVSRAAPSYQALQHCWQALEQGCRWPSRVEFWHEGKCCVCGRKLTVPESIESGIGPECAAKGGM